MEDSNAPQEWNAMFSNVENNFAPWKFSPDDRDKWVQEIGQAAEREARARLGPDRWARAHAAGRVTSIDSWIKETSSVLRKAQLRESEATRSS